MRSWSTRHLVFIGLTLAMAGQTLALERKDLLPQQSSVVIRLSSAPGFLTAVDRSPVGRLWRDPKIQDFLGKPPTGEDLLRRIFANDKKPCATQAEKEISQLTFEMMKMLKGEVVFGLNPMSKEEPFILADLAHTNYIRSIAMDRRISELKPEYMTISRSRFMDLDIYAFTHTEELSRTRSDDAEAGTENDTTNAPPKRKTVRKSWQCHVGQTLICGPDETWVKATAAKLLKEKLSEPSGDPELTLRVDIPYLIDIAAKEGQKRVAEQRRRRQEANPQNANPGAGAAEPPAPPDLAAIMKAFGLGSVGVMEARCTMKPTSCTFDATLPIGDQRKGLLSLLDATPSSTALRVPFASEQTVSYSVGRIDIAALWKAIPGIISEISPDPQAQFMFNAVVNQFVLMLGVDINADLLAHLGTQSVSVLNLQKNELEQLLAIELRNEESFRASLAKIFMEGGQIRAMLGRRLSIEKAGDRTLYVFDPSAGGTPAVADTDAPAKNAPPRPVKRFALTTAGGYFLWGEEPAVRNALQSLSAPERAARFYAGPLFQRLQRLTPKTSIGYEITDCAQTMRAVLAALTEQEGAMAEFKKSVRAGLALDQMSGDQSKLPSTDYIAAFFGPLVSYSEIREGRLVVHIDGFYPERR